jgi:CRISPR-associated protein Csb1
MEEALQAAVEDGRIKLPVIEVDFTGLELIDPIGKVTSLQAPHRIADAILRDSLFEGKPFRVSEIGKQIDSVSNRNATPLFELCPTALVFGVWDSTGPKGGLGAKFARALVSEIVGYNAASGVKTGSRIDPLENSRECPNLH